MEVISFDTTSMTKNDLLDLMLCPACQARLRSFSECLKCGTAFTEKEGTPAIFPKYVSRTVSFKFTSDRSIKSERFSACFSYPTRSGGGGSNIPYHLDLAHLDIIEQLPPGSKILEIGCGGAQMRKYIQEKGHHYIGIDISKSRVGDDLKAHGGADILCDAHFLPFIDQGFDLVYSVAVTEHLACPPLVAQEVHRVLKPGGFYLGNVSFLEPWHDDSFYHMTPLGAFELLVGARFDVSKIWPEKGYSGYRALLAMGNRATIPLRSIGGLLYLIYRTGNRIRHFVKRREKWNSERIEDLARLSGAIFWIATRPLQD